MTVPKMPPLPTYDQAKDGNVFDWIIANAPKVKAERMAAALAHRLRVPFVPLRERMEQD